PLTFTPLVFPYTTLFRSFVRHAATIASGCQRSKAGPPRPVAPRHDSHGAQLRAGTSTARQRYEREQNARSAAPDSLAEFRAASLDRKSTRLNSSHQIISY